MKKLISFITTIFNTPTKRLKIIINFVLFFCFIEMIEGAPSDFRFEELGFMFVSLVFINAYINKY